MSLDEGLRARLEFLSRVVRKEVRYLSETDSRLFGQVLTPGMLQQITQDPLLAERLEAFVSRFGRLQDTIADKLLPALLEALAERKGAVIENLDRAERFGWLDSSDIWLDMRKLRNQMVHEYIEDLTVLANALNTGHQFVPALVQTAERMISRVEQRVSESR